MFLTSFHILLLTLSSLTLCSLLLNVELRGLEEATPAADWWSLGAILYEVLTGQVCKLYSQWFMVIIALFVDPVVVPSRRGELTYTSSYHLHSFS